MERSLKLGRYELQTRLGHGGMAEVFLGRLPGVAGFEKTVVIKRLFANYAAHPAAVAMFVHEAKLAAEIHHPNIVQVFELGQEGDEYYIVMEYVAGMDLLELLRLAGANSRRVPPWFSLHVVTQVLGGLAHVHALRDAAGRLRNVVHRDVTPANIFISELGEVKLGDFGVAHDEKREWQTTLGTVKGKLAYMSPEQVRAKPLDGRTDVFAAGVVLWECLTQQRLFGGRPELEVMERICRAERRAPSTVVDDVPPELDGLVLRALAIDPERRVESAAAFQAELLEVLLRLRPSYSITEVRAEIERLTSTAGGSAFERGAPCPACSKPTEHDGRFCAFCGRALPGTIRPSARLEGRTSSGEESETDDLPNTAPFDREDVTGRDWRAPEAAPGAESMVTLRPNDHALRIEAEARGLHAAARRALELGELASARSFAVEALALVPDNAEYRATYEKLAEHTDSHVQDEGGAVPSRPEWLNDEDTARSID